MATDLEEEPGIESLRYLQFTKFTLLKIALFRHHHLTNKIPVPQNLSTSVFNRSSPWQRFCLLDSIADEVMRKTAFPYDTIPACIISHSFGVALFICIVKLVFFSHREEDEDSEMVAQLKQELLMKERKLTDIRLEALTSQHQLHQMQDAMHKMKVRL